MFILCLTLSLDIGGVVALKNSSTNNSSLYTQMGLLNSNSSDTAYGEGTENKVIKVLIYNGVYSSSNGVNGIKNALNYANTYNIIPGVTFTYSTSTVINSATLTPYNLLAMPGGNGGYYYLNSGSISSTAIKNFVYNGGGYLGICAGAYAAAQYTDGWYNGWGVAPHVNCKEINYEGGVPLQITTAGQEIFGYGGIKTLAHFNGPAMYISGNAVIFATYADSATGYKNYAAIVGDYYGKGKVVLCGPHPELSPQVPTFVAQLINWAAESSSSTTSISINQLTAASTKVKTFYETNKRLPNFVSFSDKPVTMPQFMQLIATGTIQVNNGSNSPIPIKNVAKTTNSADNFKNGNIQKSEYLFMANNIKNFIDSNGRVPNFVSTSLGKIGFETLIYMYSRIMSFYNNNGRLPGYITMNS